MRRQAKSAAGLMVVLLAAWAASAGVRLELDRRMAPYRNAPESLWITSGKVLQRLSLGNEGLLADIYWTRAVQYYGSRLRDHLTDFSLLGPLLNITVELDPKLILAYRFGAIFLSEPPPRGAGQPEQAVQLIQKGIVANPDQWRLWYDLGFVYYQDLKDYPHAAAAFLEGSRNPDAAPWMKVMAAVISEKGGNLETSRFLWTQLAQSTKDPTIRQNALEHLQGIQAMNDMDELEKLVKRFHDQTGRWPSSLSELVAAGLLPGIPADPSGLPYQIAGDGKIKLSPKSKIRLEKESALPQSR